MTNTSNNTSIEAGSLKEKNNISRREYAKICNTSIRTAHRDLKDLVKLGIVIEKGRGRALCYVRK